VRITRDDRLGGRARPFGGFVHKVFSFRRKTLRKALAQGGYDAERILGATAIDGRQRPETLTPDDFLRMFEASLAS
jgi:16S rRNA A1518/A1519 N6-dimethyltransferase RsmA/KsgA/DIM1 with predicted DNA glycosylase/AP lyase activity